MKEIFKKNKRTIILLSAIVLAGIFLRTYKFHDWLEFRDDQTRDAYLTSDVLTGKSPWPLTGPFMSYSGTSNHNEKNSFHIGPIYYYFQIISAKIFGDYPDKLAYPDTFFSILSIPLLYLFLRIYFGENLSLGLTGLYAISAYFIRYSRFAWNSNPIPFFVLLFLFSLHKFLEKNEKTPWIWVLSAGFSLGIGFQLHAITMILFSIITFFVFLFSIKKNHGSWKKWIVVFLLFIALNMPQIVSEIKTNFSNTKNFFNFPIQRNTQGSNVLILAKNDIACHAEANFLFLSSYGDDKCSTDFSSILSSNQVSDFLNISKNTINPIILSVILIFSITGYFLLIYYNKKEKETAKKYFLRLIVLYFLIGYSVMLPLSEGKLSWLEYFRFGFFMPFLFLGFFIKFISEKFAGKYIVPAVIIFSLLIFSNLASISGAISQFLDKNRTCSSQITTLGEIEPVAKYITSNLNGQEMIYFNGDKTLGGIFKRLQYLLKRQNIDSGKIGTGDNVDKINKPTFILSCDSKMSSDYAYKKIDHIYVYRVGN